MSIRFRCFVIAAMIAWLQPGAASAGDIEATSAGSEVSRPVWLVESPYDLQTTVNNIKAAITANNFKVIRQQSLDQGLVPEGQEDSSNQILYFCSFSELNRALKIDERAGVLLPCSAVVTERQGKVQVIMVNPELNSRFFDNPELSRICHELAHRYQSIIEESLL